MACTLAKRPFTPKAPTASLPPLPLRLLPGGATSSRSGVALAEVQRFFTAHCFTNDLLPFDIAEVTLRWGG